MAPDRDLAKLHPLFLPRVQELIRRVEQDGHDPYVFEAFRTFERARALAQRGTGVVMSMHCYGLAVDVISRDKLWSPPAGFWHSLEHHAATLGLTWGGHFSRPDKPHVQAVPVRLQGRVRRGTPAELDRVVRACLS